MDNEKKIHEQSLALARQLIEKDPSLRDWVVSKFPELAESEDERIRKDILRFLKAKIENCTSPTPAKSTLSMWIAYLEKQKEQKPVALDDETMTNLDRALCIVKDARGKLPSYQSDDGIYECNKAIEALEHILYNGLEKTEEPQDYSGLTNFERAIHRGFLCAGVENVPVNIIKETAKDCLAQIKPAEWSEEDESMLWNIISIVGQCKSVQADSMLDWLKSLRPQPQGVFEQAVRAIYEMCHSYRNKGVFTDERACDFMGNVRLKCKDAIECSPILDEPHWKPSEEQMDNLLRVASALDAMHYKNESKVLVEFYNNLKS